MTGYYTDIRALIDPEQSDPLPGGGRSQEVSLILTDDSDRDWIYRLTPSGITLRAEQARELAFALLVCAEHAEQIGERA
jgi:hypothetical protein